MFVFGGVNAANYGNGRGKILSLPASVYPWMDTLILARKSSFFSESLNFSG